MSIQSSIIKYLEETNFKTIDKSRYLENTNSLGYPDLNLRLFDNLGQLMTNSPELIIKHFRDSVINHQSFFNLIFKSESNITTDKPTFQDNLKSIGVFWETVSLYDFLAKLNSNDFGRELTEPNAILKSFQKVGFNSNTNKQLRQLRNAYAHNFSMQSGFIVDDQGRHVAHAGDLEGLVKQIDDFMNWYVKTFYYLLKSYPEFLSLVIYACYSGYREAKTEIKESFKFLDNLNQKSPQSNELNSTDISIPPPSNFFDYIIQYPNIYKAKQVAKAFGDGINDLFENLFSSTPEERDVLIFLFAERVMALLRHLGSLSEMIENTIEKQRMRAFIILVAKRLKPYLKNYIENT